MARGRRLRRKNRRQQHQAVSTEYGEQFNDEGGSRKPEPGTELVDEETLVALREQVEPGQFKESGFKCDRCNYVTKRKGLSGIQGLRSHTRIHVRNRRAAYRPMKIQAAVLLASLCIALLPLFIDTTVLLPVPALPELAGWHGPLVVTAAPAVVAAYTWFVGVRFVNFGRRKLVTRIELGVLAGDVLLVAVAATWTYAAAVGIRWPWLLGAAVPPVRD